MFTRRQPKTIIIKQNRDQQKSLHRRCFSDVEIETKIKSIMVKIVQDLKRRHRIFFKNQIITETNLKESLFCLLKEEDFTNFDYNNFLTKAEQECIIQPLKNPNNKVNKTTNITNYKNEDINQNKNINLSQNDFILNEDKEINNRTHIVSNAKEKDAMDFNSKSILSPLADNSYTNIMNLLHLNNSSLKYEELKNVKEKDQWGMILKKDYDDFINEKINKLQEQAEKKKEFTHFLASQIIEKQNQKALKMNNDIKLHENLIKEIENSKLSEIKKKEKNEIRIKEFMEHRDKLFIGKLKYEKI
jgi:hypothetical protein